MASSSKIFVWAVPAAVDGAPWDHTWVTTYDSRVATHATLEKVVTAKELYWFCWGSFYVRGTMPKKTEGFLGSQLGDLSLARCLVQPNASSQSVAAARGTILRYAVDGVCHQLANQVLYAVGAHAAEPLTVKKARGYWASVYLYKNYGRRSAAWATKIKSCGALPEATMSKPEDKERAITDDFETRARGVLESKDPQLLRDLLTLRAGAHHYSGTESIQLSARAINIQNQNLLDQAAELLGQKYFTQIFGFPSAQRINLVDPAIIDAGNYENSEGRLVRRAPEHKAATITLRQIAAALAADHDLSKRLSEEIASDLVKIIHKHLKKGQRVRIGGLGILQVRNRAARVAHNPATGAVIKIKAGKTVAFRAAKELRDSL